MPREFTMPKYEENPLSNFVRLKKTSRKTIEEYLTLFARFNNEGLEDSIRAIESRREKGDIKYATVRKYKSAILAGLSFIAKTIDNADEIPIGVRPFFLKIALDTDLEVIEQLYKRVYDWRVELDGQNQILDHLAHVTHGDGRVSSKQKGFDKELSDYILSLDRDSFNTLKQFIRLNLILGLRPEEYKQACIVTNLENKDSLGNQGQSQQYWLQVKNAKNSFGRACGNYRYLGIDAFSDEQRADLQSFLEIAPSVNFDNLQRQLLGILKRHDFCKSFLQKQYTTHRKSYFRLIATREKKGTKKPINTLPPIKQKPSLYSTRHQAIANAKSMGFSKEQIAALFGHISVETARKHYGSQAKGYSGLSLVPHSSNLEAVLNHAPKKSITPSPNQSPLP